MKMFCTHGTRWFRKCVKCDDFDMLTKHEKDSLIAAILHPYAGKQLWLKLPLSLTELEMKALVRQTFRIPIPWEGSSGPVVHALLNRIRDHVGPEKYAEFVAEPNVRDHHTQRA